MRGAPSTSRTANVWAMPIMVTFASSVALIIGLVADGAADVVAWLGAGLPLVLTTWHVARAFRRQGPD